MLATIERGLERLAGWLAAAGAIIIVVQTVWISYGVFMRYVVGKPDGTVTEATALLLFPAALLGLAFAAGRQGWAPGVTALCHVSDDGGERAAAVVRFTSGNQPGTFMGRHIHEW